MFCSHFSLYPIQWVQEANNHLNTQADVIKKSFKVCGITNALDRSENDIIHCARELPDIQIPYGDTDINPDNPFQSSSEEDSSINDWDDGSDQDN